MVFFSVRVENILKIPNNCTGSMRSKSSINSTGVFFSPIMACVISQLIGSISPISSVAADIFAIDFAALSNFALAIFSFNPLNFLHCWAYPSASVMVPFKSIPS